ncbi:MAG: hypothetical protein NTNFB01_12430 [Nitrospira sp.]
MAGTVYPYNYQDMPIREIPDGFSYHMFARRPSIPFFTQAGGPQVTGRRRMHLAAAAMQGPQIPRPPVAAPFPYSS